MSTEGFSQNALKILETRYFLKNEKGKRKDKSPSDLFRRVSEYIASAEKTKAVQKKWAEKFFDVMMARDFIPNSPTLTGAGRDFRKLYPWQSDFWIMSSKSIRIPSPRSRK